MSREATLHFLARTPAPFVLLDLDGTLVRGEAAVEGAGALVRALGPRCAIVSNNSVDSAREVAARLARLGIGVPASRVVLAGEVALDWIAATRPGARVMTLGGDASRAGARGLVSTDDAPAFVLATRDPAVDLARIGAAADAVRAGAELIVANPDLWHPGPDARRVPETGAMLAAVLACAGDVRYRVIGKPEPELFVRALSALGATVDRTLVVGDNPDTDGRGARALGMACALVGVDAQLGWPDLASFLLETRLLPASATMAAK